VTGVADELLDDEDDELPLPDEDVPDVLLAAAAFFAVAVVVADVVVVVFAVWVSTGSWPAASAAKIVSHAARKTVTATVATPMRMRCARRRRRASFRCACWMRSSLVMDRGCDRALSGL
jgi:hypothetical protein